MQIINSSNNIPKETIQTILNSSIVDGIDYNTFNNNINEISSLLVISKIYKLICFKSKKLKGLKHNDIEIFGLSIINLMSKWNTNNILTILLEEKSKISNTQDIFF